MSTEKSSLLHSLTQNSDYLSRSDRAKQCVTSSSVLVNTSGTQLVPARSEWQKDGVPDSHINTLINTDGSWNYTQSFEHLLNAMSMSEQECIEYVLQIVAPLYKPVQPFLDANAKLSNLGFNTHSLELHIDRVLFEALRYLKEASLNGEKVNQVAFAALAHDAGNAEGRSIHSLIVPHLLEVMYQTDLFKVPQLAPALIAIISHDEPIIFPQINRIKDEATALANTERVSAETVFFDLYKTQMDPVQSVLRMADKSDVGPNRIINTRRLTPEAFEQDPHFLVNAFWRKEKSGLQPNGVFELRFQFSRLPSELLLEQRSDLLKTRSSQDGKKIALPQKIKDKYNATQPETFYFYQLIDLFMKLYLHRMLIYMIDMFNVYSDVTRCNIVFVEYDEKNPEKKYQEVVFPFSRQSIFSDMDLLGRIYSTE